jgi:dihydroorotate dehydrogenase (fumarate)
MPVVRGIDLAARTGMNISTSYLGMRLAHPFIAGASPYGYRVETIRRLEDAGCAAVVLHSLFEEQISGAAAPFPDRSEYPFGPDDYAAHVDRAKRAVAIPIIASINGHRATSWLSFAPLIEQAGADALELNVYNVPAEPHLSGADIEAHVVAMVRELKRCVRIPVAVKVSPFFTAFGHFARQLDEAGADGLVLFNRFYQPNIDIRTMSMSPQADLSTNAELPLRLRWMAVLCGRVRPSLALSGGVAEPHDGIKAILAGADVVQLVSALLRHGPAHVALMRSALERWLEWHQMVTVDEARGAVSLKGTADGESFERAQYINTLHSWVG